MEDLTRLVDDSLERHGVRPTLRGDPHPLGEQRGQPASLGQRHDRHQPGARHEVRIVEPRRDRAASVR